MSSRAAFYRGSRARVVENAGIDNCKTCGKAINRTRTDRDKWVWVHVLFSDDILGHDAVPSNETLKAIADLIPFEGEK